ncbi:MAG: O-antigen ligase family protein [Armatimonadota bacterium]
MAEETTTQASPVPDWLYWLSLALLFVAPCQYAYAVDVKHGPFIAYVDILACLVVGLWLLRVLILGQWRSLVWAPRHVWALIAVAIISGFGAQNLKSAALEIVQFVLYFAAVYMLFTNALNTDARRRTAVRALLLATTLVVLYGLFQYVTATDLIAVKSTFGSRGAYSGFLTIVLPLFFGLVLFSELTWERYWAGAVVVLGALTILLPPLVWILALIIAAMALNWGHGRTVPAVLGFAAIFLLVTLSVVPLNRQAFREMANPYEEGPIFKTMGVEQTEGNKPDAPIVKKRWIEWMPGLTMLAQNFVLGIGTGNYQLNIGQPEYYGFLPNVHKSEADTNNLFLVVAGTMGFAGLVCLLAFMGHFWQYTGHLWEFGQTPWGRALTCGLWGMALAIPCANLFTSTFVRGTALVWAFGYALIGSLAEQATQIRGWSTYQRG